MKAMIVLCAMLLALTVLAEDKPMLAKDGTPLPEGVARIVKWELSKLRTTKKAVGFANDSELRKAISGMPKDGVTYRTGVYDGGFTVVMENAKSGDVTSYIYRCNPPRDTSRTYVIIE